MLHSLRKALAKRIKPWSPPPRKYPNHDMEPDFLEMYEACKGFSMVSVERMYAIYKAIEYIASAGIPGDIVECGVWKGGCVMMAAYTLKRLQQERWIWLYDTFTGMTKPTEVDINFRGYSAVPKWEQTEDYLSVSRDEVKKNIHSTGWNQFCFIQGDVLDTIPGATPSQIALLRLDTDWYESTRHELEYLYPLLAPGGILLIDDYGHWLGAKKAVDEYFGGAVFLSRTDRTGRIVVKPKGEDQSWDYSERNHPRPT